MEKLFFGFCSVTTTYNAECSISLDMMLAQGPSKYFMSSSEPYRKSHFRVITNSTFWL